MSEPTWNLELYWIPLGAGASVVRHSGRLYERVAAAWQHRPQCDLYHSALVATTPDGVYTIEMTPVPEGHGGERGVVAEGPVGSRALGRWRLFRYEIRCWQGGDIPDLGYAVGGPVQITQDQPAIVAALEVVCDVPRFVWGRDEASAGDMWNSNSVVSWTLTSAGLITLAGQPPERGRAPGWKAGVITATRRTKAE